MRNTKKTKDTKTPFASSSPRYRLSSGRTTNRPSTPSRRITQRTFAFVTSHPSTTSRATFTRRASRRWYMFQGSNSSPTSSLKRQSPRQNSTQWPRQSPTTPRRRTTESDHHQSPPTPTPTTQQTQTQPTNPNLLPNFTIWERLLTSKENGEKPRAEIQPGPPGPPP